MYSLTWRGATFASFKILWRCPKTSSSVSSCVGTIRDGFSALAYSKPYLSLAFRGCTQRQRKLAMILKPVKPCYFKTLICSREGLIFLRPYGNRGSFS
jgi:hypothetical protein